MDLARRLVSGLPLLVFGWLYVAALAKHVRTCGPDLKHGWPAVRALMFVSVGVVFLLVE